MLQQIIYAWAKNAPKLVLPDGVAFKIGGKTKVKYLTLQVHYADVSLFKGKQINKRWHVDEKISTMFM